MAAGCWSGSLTQDLFRGSDIVLNLPVKPRKVRISNEYLLIVALFTNSLYMSNNIFHAALLK